MTFWILLLCLITTLPVAIGAGCTSASQCSFVDTFRTKDTNRWRWADGYGNGRPFNNWWSARNVQYSRNGQMKISIGKTPRFGTQYVSGETRSAKWHGYGCYEVRMKPVKQPGLVSSFFTFTGPYDAAPGFPRNHQEIDIEFLYRKNAETLVMQCNYFKDGRHGDVQEASLPFSPWKGFHNYAFKWTRSKIEWYADGRKVCEATSNIPQIASGPMKIMFNFWPVDSSLINWAGKYIWNGPQTAQYDAVRFTEGESCRIVNSFWSSEG